MIGRGGLSEISTYMDELEVKTEFSQGAAQLCPVGNLNIEAGSDLTDEELDSIMMATPTSAAVSSEESSAVVAGL